MKVILTEAQMRRLICEEILGNLSEEDPMKLCNSILSTLMTGKTTPEQAIEFANNFNEPVRTYLLNAIRKLFNMPETEAPEVQKQPQKALQKEEPGVWKNNLGNWKLISDDTLATVYNATPGQCNKDVAHTASMFRIDRANVLAHRIIAMERTFMEKLGLKWGDIVYVEGTGKWDGPWQIQDTMNKRFAGMHKIDFLVPRTIRTGSWDNVKLSVPVDKKTAANAKSMMKGPV